jgi:hypothetical protein
MEFFEIMNPLVDSLQKSLEALQRCVDENTDLLANLDAYVEDAEETAFRIRRSLVSIFPFGEFKAGRVPIHENNHTVQHEAFSSRFLLPMNQRPEWSEAEKELLGTAIDILYPSEQQGPETYNWESIADQCRRLDRSFSRPSASCRVIFFNELREGVDREWSKEEDDLLSELVTEFNGTNWVEIGERLNRPPAQCYKRCYANIHPVLVPIDFSEEDDARLKEAVETHGDSNWMFVAADLNTGHTERQCMNRWTKTLKPGIQSGKWNPVLDAKLKAAVAILGDKNWSYVSKFVDGRTDRKCRERYSEYLREGLKRSTEWTASEDEQLVETVRRHGVGKWSKISSEIDARTDQMCRYRFLKIYNNYPDLKESFEAHLDSQRGEKDFRSRKTTPVPSPARPRGRPRLSKP